MKIKPVSSILCDQIRREDNGKLLLIGMYPQAVINITPQMGLSEEGTGPITMSLTLFLYFEAEDDGDISVDVRVFRESDGMAVMGTVSLSLSIMPEAPDLPTAVLPDIPVFIDRPGKISIDIRNTGDDDWQSLKVIQINHVESIVMASAPVPDNLTNSV